MLSAVSNIADLDQLALTQEEAQYLEEACGFLGRPYLDFLATFRLNPCEHVTATFKPITDTGGEEDLGDVEIVVRGPWVDVVLFEIPLLALTSEAYFRFVDTDWTHDGQEEKAYAKGMRLFKAGCVMSEYGTRRRRDFHTHQLVVRGLLRARAAAEELGCSGKLSGTSNVHLARVFGLTPKGTVGHEWFMGIAALTGDYRTATTEALACWLGCFGDGIWKITPTDTFGTPFFLDSLRQPVPQNLLKGNPRTFANAFIGVRQDSGNPVKFIQTMRAFYDQEGINETKTLVFSDSLNVESCLTYKRVAEEAGFETAFGIGTDLTNNFTAKSNGQRSPPLNVVMKLKSANGNAAVKLSDVVGKHSGDRDVIQKVKKEVRYQDIEWTDGDESKRWR